MANRRWRMPLLALLTLPSVLGVLLISWMSWRLFDPAVTRSTEVALEVLEDMIRTTGSESLRYPLAVGDAEGVERLAEAMARNNLVFAVQVEDDEGRLVARAQNRNLPIGEGIQLIEHRQKLYIQAMQNQPLVNGAIEDNVYVGEVLFQLTPHVLAEEKARLVSGYQLLIGAVLFVGLLLILVATRILWRSASTITRALRRIAAGERDVVINDTSRVTEFDVIARGVNRLSKNVDEARAAQETSLQQLEVAVQQAQQSDRETRDFYETATREIADPVMQVAELLKLNQQTPTPVDPAVILANAERVKLSVLAMLGKLQESSEESVTRDVNLSDYFDTLAQQYQVRFSRKGLAFFVERKEAAPPHRFEADIGTLDIVMEKLLENALIYTPQGEVRVCWQIEDGYDATSILLVTVKDNGVGIDAEMLGSVFERYAGKTSEGTPAAGSGLGLYIARELLYRRGGSLDVVSQRGVGSEFAVRLPVIREEQAEKRQSTLAGRTVLTVGLTLSQQQTIDAVLLTEGINGLQADTAIEALAILAQQPVHLLLVDEEIDDIDVVSFLAEARKRTRELRTVILTQDGGAAEGKSDHVLKPLAKAGFATLLQQLSGEGIVDYRLANRFRSKSDGDHR